MITNADKVRKIPKQIHEYLSKAGTTNLLQPPTQGQGCLLDPIESWMETKRTEHPVTFPDKIKANLPGRVKESSSDDSYVPL